MTEQSTAIGPGRAPFPVVLLVQGLVGVGLGAAFALAGSSLGAWYAASGTGAEHIELGGVLGAVVAYPLGVALGVGLTGQGLRYPGSMLGAAIGSVLGSGSLLLAAWLGLRSSPPVLWGAFALLGPLASIAAYYLANGRVQRLSAGVASLGVLLGVYLLWLLVGICGLQALVGVCRP